MSERMELKKMLADFPVKKPSVAKRAIVDLKPPTPAAAQTKVGGETEVPADTRVGTDTRVPRETEVAAKATVVAKTMVGTAPQAATQTSAAPTTNVDGDIKVDARTRVMNATTVPNHTQVLAKTGIDPQTMVPPQTEVKTSTTVDVATSVVNITGEDSAREQDSSVILESKTASRLNNGYTRLPNSILMQIVAGGLVRSEVQILLAIARFTISFQRRHAPLSKAVLARRTGLRGPSVLQAISDLAAKGLIEKIPGDQYKPNLLGLKFTDDWDFFPKGDGTETKSATTTSHPAQVATQTQVATPTAATVPAPTPAGVAPATYFKNSKTIINKSSFSMLPDNLREYFVDLKPAKKFETELAAFETLAVDFSTEDIAACLAEVTKNGIRGGPTGVEASEHCHSPMAFLSYAMADVLKTVQAKHAKALEQEGRARALARTEQERREAEEREKAEWAIKERAFKKAFPGKDRQREVLHESCRGTPFRANSETGWAYAVGKWWNSLNTYERLGVTK